MNTNTYDTSNVQLPPNACTSGIYRVRLHVAQTFHLTILNMQKFYDTIRYDTRCHFKVRSKADISQLNLPHGTDN